MDVNLDEVKLWISKGAQPSERVAKLLYKSTNDAMFKKFYKEIERKALPKNEKTEA
jgi:ribosomal protein S16